MGLPVAAAGRFAWVGYKDRLSLLGRRRPSVQGSTVDQPDDASYQPCHDPGGEGAAERQTEPAS